MLTSIVKPAAHLVKTLKAHDTPHQLAGGFAIGAVIGVVPLGNVISVGLCALLCGVKVNKSAGVLGAMALMWVGVLLDPVAHNLGMKILSIEALQGTYAAIYDMPLGPWIGFNNTVVLGWLVLGTYFSYPIFWLSYLACRWVQRSQASRIRDRELRQLVDNLNVGAQWETAA